MGRIDQMIFSIPSRFQCIDSSGMALDYDCEARGQMLNVQEERKGRLMAGPFRPLILAKLRSDTLKKIIKKGQAGQYC